MKLTQCSASIESFFFMYIMEQHLEALEVILFQNGLSTPLRELWLYKKKMKNYMNPQIVLAI